MGLVLQGPGRSRADADGDGKEVDGQRQRNDEEGDDAASLGPAGEFIEKDEADEDDKKHPPLGQGVFAVNLEKHTVLIIR